MLLFVSTTLVGCLPPPVTSGPKAALQQYTRHLKQGKSKEALDLLSVHTKKGLNQILFERFLSQGALRLREIFAELDAEEQIEVEVRATVRAGKQTEIELVCEGQEWRLESGPVVPPTGFSPESVVEKLLQSIESQDCEALLDCAPPKVLTRYRRQQLLQGCREQMKFLIQTAAKVRRTRIKPMMISKNRAELPYAQNRKLVVVKHQDSWYLEDL